MFAAVISSDTSRHSDSSAVRGCGTSMQSSIARMQKPQYAQCHGAV
jgi:hypothetical protein